MRTQTIWAGLLALLIILAVITVPTAAQGDDDPAPTGTPPPTSEPVDLSEACRAAVDSMRDLTAGLTLPEHFTHENAPRQGDEFDVNTYFDVLDELAVGEGYALDYVYWYNEAGGSPVLYIRPADQPAFVTLQGVEAAWDEDIESELVAYENYLGYIEVSGTPESYLQLVVLDVMARQFYLYWHANYNDWQVVCDDDAVEAILTRINEIGEEPDGDVIEQARELDVTPTVTLGEDGAAVEVVFFTKWGGFYRVTTTIQQATPRPELEWASEAVVEYEIGLVF